MWKSPLASVIDHCVRPSYQMKCIVMSCRAAHTFEQHSAPLSSLSFYAFCSLCNKPNKTNNVVFLTSAPYVLAVICVSHQRKHSLTHTNTLTLTWTRRHMLTARRWLCPAGGWCMAQVKRQRMVRKMSAHRSRQTLSVGVLPPSKPINGWSPICHMSAHKINNINCTRQTGRAQRRVPAAVDWPELDLWTGNLAFVTMHVARYMLHIAACIQKGRRILEVSYTLQIRRLV